MRQHRARSILCVPLMNQAQLTGALYLENNLTARAFSPARIAVLKLVASQAAISLENARLYRDVAEREAKIRRLVEANIIGITVWSVAGEVLEANDAFLRMVGYAREDLVSGRVRWRDLTPPEMRQDTDRAGRRASSPGASRRSRRNTSARMARGCRSSSAWRLVRRGPAGWRGVRARPDRAQAGRRARARGRAALPRGADRAGARQPGGHHGAAGGVDRARGEPADCGDGDQRPGRDCGGWAPGRPMSTRSGRR